jgi:PAS domain S-box-containing protein
MESKLPPGYAPTPSAGDDRVRRVEAAPPSLPADVDPGEDDQTEYAALAPSARARAQRIEAAFERVAVGLAVVSPQGRWLRVNQRLCDILGYEREEFAARSWQDLTFPDDRDASDAFFRQTLSGERDVYEMDKRYVRKDGAPVWVHLTTSLVRTPAGEPDYFTTTLEDITERKRLEHERAQLQALTDTALSHLALDDLLRELLGRVTAVMGVDNVAILLLDEDGRTLTVRAGRGVLEVAIGRVHIQMGHGFSGRIAASREPLIVDDLSIFEGPSPLLRNNLHSVVGVPLLVDDRVEDHLVSRLVGVVHVGSAAPRRFTAADVQLLQRAADRIALAIERARLYAAEQDDRQRAEAALARAQASEAQAAERAERLNTILDTMAEGVAMFDTASHPIQMNRAFRELHGVERESLAAHTSLPAGNRVRLLDLRDAVTGAPLPTQRTPVARALRGEMVTGPGADIRLRAFDGRELEVNSSAVPLRDGDGRIVGAVLVVHDQTERKQLEREREAAHVHAERQADQLDRIFEAVTDGLVVWDIERQQARELLPAAGARVFGPLSRA